MGTFKVNKLLFFSLNIYFFIVGSRSKMKYCSHFRLQKLIPTMSIKDNVTQLDIILEAIRYIDSLREKLDRGMEMWWRGWAKKQRINIFKTSMSFLFLCDISCDYCWNRIYFYVSFLDRFVFIDLIFYAPLNQKSCSCKMLRFFQFWC